MHSTAWRNTLPLLRPTAIARYAPSAATIAFTIGFI
jgi:hypothetical protein